MLLLFSVLLVKVKPQAHSCPCQLPDDMAHPAPLQSTVIQISLFVPFPLYTYSPVLQQLIMNLHDLHRCSSLICPVALPGILLPPLPQQPGGQGDPCLASQTWG